MSEKQEELLRKAYDIVFEDDRHAGPGDVVNLLESSLEKAREHAKEVSKFEDYQTDPRR
jgi:hypothetical protein